MSDTRPVYLRLREQIAAAIIDGRYGEGEMLPSVRAFAAEQGANPLTVAKAYQQFQTDGLIRVLRGVGMFARCGRANGRRFWNRNGPPSGCGSSGWDWTCPICSNRRDRIRADLRRAQARLRYNRVKNAPWYCATSNCLAIYL